MQKRAAIYVRVSSERQAGIDRVSIESQLSECEAHCQTKGYFIVERYIDKDKYRSKGKLVQPSGQRKDRPGYQALLKAARNNTFDVIVAWKEDRLYRGMYAAMPLSEILDEMGKRLDVDLVREQFDHRMLGIKAAMGKIEVDNIRERMLMGRRARLERGEVPGGNQVKYGYKKVDKRLAIAEDEAAIVRKIFDLYLEGKNNMQIRKYLNDNDIPPRKSKIWHKSIIIKMLSSEFYATGQLPTTLDNETFYIPCPPIISMDVWQRSQKVRQGNKKKARNVKRDYLCIGITYCACGWKNNVRTVRNKNYTKVSGAYVCQRYWTTPENRPIVCATDTGSLKVDNYVWGFVKRVCQNPEIVKQAIQAKLERLQTEHDQLQQEFDALKNKLDDVNIERQWIITQARKGKITEDDMDFQLGQLQIQEWEIRKVLDEYQTLLATRQQIKALADWADQYLADIKAGIESLEIDVTKLEEKDFMIEYEKSDAARFSQKFPDDKVKQLKWAILEEKRRIVRMLLKKVIIGRNEDGTGRKITPVLALDIPLEKLTVLNSSDQSLSYIENDFLALTTDED